MKVAYKRDISLSDTDDSVYWISISDLMSGLLIIFILTLTYYMLIYSEKTARLTENDILKKEIMETIAKEMKKHNFNVIIDEDHWVIHLPDDILFDSGSAKLKEKGKKLINILAPVLYNVLTEKKFEGRVDTFFIEGHTDKISISEKLKKKFPSNWELSAQRAINTWRELTEVGEGLDKELIEAKEGLKKLVNDKKEKLFSVSGYSSNRPIKTDDPDNLQQNRRIDLRIAMSPPTKDKPPHLIARDLQNRINTLEK